MNLAYIPELKKIGKIIKYTNSITGGKYLIDIQGSEKSFKTKQVTLLDKEYTNQALWHLAEFKLIPDGAEFRNHRGTIVKFVHEKLESGPADNSTQFDKLYKFHDKWVYIEIG